MELFFIPLACSLACRITVYEACAGEAVTFRKLALDKKVTREGEDLRNINALEKVPALRLPDGSILTESSAILLYLADKLAEGQLAPKDGLDRYRVISWLSFVGSEMHMRAFGPLVSSVYNAEQKARALEDAPARLAYLDAHLKHNDFLVNGFSVADAALAAILNWSDFIRYDLSPYPAVADYKSRLFARPHVARARLDDQRAVAD